MFSKVNKKGISEVVAYALLIIIAVGLAAGVYSFLKAYIPKEKAECSSDISLILENYNCDSNGLTINITNTGLFKIDGIYVWLGNSTIKKQIHTDNNLLFIPPLDPNQKYEKYYQIYPIFAAEGKYDLTIEPIVIKNNLPIACANAIMKQTIACTPS